MRKSSKSKSKLTFINFSLKEAPWTALLTVEKKPHEIGHLTKRNFRLIFNNSLSWRGKMEIFDKLYLKVLSEVCEVFKKCWYHIFKRVREEGECILV